MDPIETIYVKNLNDKVSLTKLKATLDDLFAKYGKVVQITAHRNLKMKGQAFVTFESKQASANALKELQNHAVFDKPMTLEYAKANSDNYFSSVINDDSTVKIRKQRKQEASTKQQELYKEQQLSKQLLKKSKKNVPDFEKLPPNKLLLAQNLSKETTNELLLEFFETSVGFVNIRFIKARNLAFVEYETDALATEILQNLDQEQFKAKFGTDAILTYAKK